MIEQSVLRDSPNILVTIPGQSHCIQPIDTHRLGSRGPKKVHVGNDPHPQAAIPECGKAGVWGCWRNKLAWQNCVLCSKWLFSQMIWGFSVFKDSSVQCNYGLPDALTINLIKMSIFTNQKHSNFATVNQNRWAHIFIDLYPKMIYRQGIENISECHNKSLLAISLCY